MIAPKSWISPGLYYLDITISNSSTTYLPIPPLKVVAYPTKCSISLPSNALNFQIGGASLPYILDFSNCIPETSVSLNIYA